MSAGLLGPVLCLLLWLLEDDFLGLLFELFCREELCLFFFLGLTVGGEKNEAIRTAATGGRPLEIRSRILKNVFVTSVKELEGNNAGLRSQM